MSFSTSVCLQAAEQTSFRVRSAPLLSGMTGCCGFAISSWAVQVRTPGKAESGSVHWDQQQGVPI